MAGLEDEEAQINGVVDVLYVVDSDTATGTGTKTAAAAADDAASKKKKSNGAGDGDDGDGYGDDEEENHKYSLQDTFKELLAEGSDMINDLPFRMVAFHFCYSEQRLRPVMRLIQWMIGQPIRLRFRAHYGTFFFFFFFFGLAPFPFYIWLTLYYAPLLCSGKLIIIYFIYIRPKIFKNEHNKTTTQYNNSTKQNTTWSSARISFGSSVCVDDVWYTNAM